MKVFKGIALFLLVVVFSLILFGYMNFKGIVKGILNTNKITKVYYESDLKKEIPLYLNDELSDTLKNEYNIDYEADIIPNDYLESQMENVIIGVLGYMFNEYNHLPKVYIDPIKDRIIEVIIDIIYEKGIQSFKKQTQFMSKTNNSNIDDIYSDIKEKYGEKYFEDNKVNTENIQDILDKYDIEYNDDEFGLDVKRKFVEEKIRNIGGAIGFEIEEEDINKILEEIKESDEIKEIIKENTKNIVKNFGFYNTLKTNFDLELFKNEVFNNNFDAVYEFRELINNNIRLINKLFLMILIPFLLLILIVAYDKKTILEITFTIGLLQGILLIITAFIKDDFFERILNLNFHNIGSENLSITFSNFISDVINLYQYRLLIYSLVFLVLSLISMLCLYIYKDKIEKTKNRLLIPRISIGIILFIFIGSITIGFTKRIHSQNKTTINKIEKSVDILDNKDIEYAFLKTLGIDINSVNKNIFEKNEE